MKSILIFCDNDPINLLLTNAVAKPLSFKYEVYLQCADKYAPLFVNNQSFLGAAENKEYDVVAYIGQIEQKYKAAKYVDFTTEAGEIYSEARLGKIITQRNLFQLFFQIFDLTWKGEGYDLHYLPRNRQKKNSLGILLKDQWLKEFIKQNIKVWEIPFKANIVKQLDEINRCSCVITDDESCVHMALALRKQVEYVVKTETKYLTEMFGSGEIHLLD